MGKMKKCGARQEGRNGEGDDEWRRSEPSSRAKEDIVADSCSSSTTAGVPPVHTASLRDRKTDRKSICDEEKEGKAEWHWLGRKG